MNFFGFSNFDELLAFHCAPVLAGIKPANLIVMPSGDEEMLTGLLQKYNCDFAGRGLVFKRLCGCSKRRLLLVYNCQALRNTLTDRGYRAYLVAAGYGLQENMEEDLARLEKRIQSEAGFPHEIGVFLGYPLEDILGFVINKGDNCKYSGYWKVYGDVARAQKVFAAYERCRDYFLAKLSEGMPLHIAAARM